MHLPGASDQDGGDNNGNDFSGLTDGSSFYLVTPDGAGLQPSGSGGGGAVTDSTTTTTTNLNSTSPFVINIQWGQGVSSAPTGFVTAVQNAVTFLESEFQNPV